MFQVGPAGAHFALLATLIVEILHCWPMLKYPRRALFKLIIILVVLLMLGVLPWVDNYAHLFGFIFGFLAAYAFMPFISFGHYDRRRKVLLIWICTILIVGLFTLLLALFYNIPVYECEICKLFNCIPFTRDFCASQNINFKREESVWHMGPRFPVEREVPFGPQINARFYILNDQLQFKILAAIFTLGHYSDGSERSRGWRVNKKYWWRETKEKKIYIFPENEAIFVKKQRDTHLKEKIRNSA